MPSRLISFQEKFAKPLAAGALLSSFLAVPAAANPSGASIQSGQVNITGGAGSMSIQQFTDKAIINWQNFGIGVNESVQFLQPSQLSVILNRVTGQDPTQILGQMSANGNVWIINPNGVLFGPQSQINVGGLLASTLNITNEDFLNGNYRFTQDQNKALASVVNQGSITITDGGYAVLMAPLVSNEGMIVANLGQVNLMSGESATLNFDGRNLISYDIGHVDSADPGTVVVDRSTVSALLSNVIQNPNLTEAGGIVENPDGSVSLVGAADTVVNSGTISANGADGQKAGKVVLESGRLTVVGADSVTEASGVGANSDGGEVIALSHGTMKMEAGAVIEAKGGDISGDGGFIDTSGYGRIILEDYADASAIDGENGTWLIDPEFLAIIDGSDGAGQLDDGATPPNQFSNNGNSSDGIGGQSSSLSVGFLEGLASGTDVVIQADIQITINDLAGDQTIDFQDGVDVEFLTGTGDILFADPDDAVRVGGDGNLTFTSGRDLYLGTAINEGSGTIALNVTRDIYDGNGAAANIVGDFLTFDSTSSAVEVSADSDYGDPPGSVAGGLDISGFSQANPVQITLNSNNDINLDIVGGGVGGSQPATAGSLLLSGDVLTTSDLQTASPATPGPGVGTNLIVDHADDLTLNGVQVASATIDADGNISGGGASATQDIIANSATLLATGSVNNVDADVAVLDVGTTGGGNVSVDNVDATLTDLTVRVNGGNVNLEGNSVLNGAGTFTYSDGTTANNFTLIDSSNDDIEIGSGISAQGISLTTGGSILNDVDNATDIITADTIELVTTGADKSIGTFDVLDAMMMVVTPAAPIRVQGRAASTTDISVSTVNGPVNIEHADNDPSFIRFNDPNGDADVLNVDDPNADSFSSFSFNRTGTGANAGDILVGTLGSSTQPLTSVSLQNSEGDILNFDATSRIFSETLSVIALGGSVGESTDPLIVSSSNITAQATGMDAGDGVFITNIGDLEVFSLISDADAEALISAGNGSLQLTGGVLSTPTNITDIGVGTPAAQQQAGDTDGDGYNVTLDVTLTGGGDVALGGIGVDGSDGPGAGVQGTDGDSLIRVTHQTGNINGGGPITATGDTDVELVAQAGGIGTGAEVSINTDTNSPGELLLDAAAGAIDVDVTAGQFDVVTVQHDNVNVDVTGTSGVIDSDGLDITGTANTSTINYTNRTGDIPLGLVTTNGSDVNITAQAGSVTGTVDGTDDIVVGINDRVTVNATGDFSADASSLNVTNDSSLEIGTVGGDVTLRNNSVLSLNEEIAGTIGGALNVDNDGTLVLSGDNAAGNLTVGGSATFTNSDTVVGDGVGTDLTAASLVIVNDDANTSFNNVTTDVASISVDDDNAGAGSGSVGIANVDDLDFVTINSNATFALVATLNTGGAFQYTGTTLGTFAPNMDVGTFTLTEAAATGVTMGTVALDNARMTDVNITTTNGDINSTGTLTTLGNATFDASGAIDIDTSVAKDLTVVADTGDITFDDTNAAGPANINVTTDDGKDVDGTWITGQLDYTGDTTDTLSIDDLSSATDGAGANDTNVLFESGSGDIVLDVVDVSKNANLTLNAFDGGAGNILDTADATTDIYAANATLLANGDIGTMANPIEVCVPGELTARTNDGSVFIDSLTDTIEHVIIDVSNDDFVIRFAEYDGMGGASTDVVTVDYTSQTISVNNSNGGNTMSGTDLTVIERDNVDVEIGTDIDVTGGGDGPLPSDDNEFVRIISGGGITNNSGSTISASNADFIANDGNLGSSTSAIITSVEDLCVSARGEDAEGFFINETDINDLFLIVNQDNTTTGGNVVVLYDNGGTYEGVQMADNVLSTVESTVAVAAPTPGDAADAGNLQSGTLDDSNIYVVNGNFDLTGDFTADGGTPGGENTATFSRENTLEAGTGGDVLIGDYNTNSPDAYLEVQARGADSGVYQAAGGSIDMSGGGEVVLVAEGTNIGTDAGAAVPGNADANAVAGPIQIVTNAAASTDADYVEVRAATANLDGEADEGNIVINASGNVGYEKVIAGTNLSFVAPLHDNGGAGFSEGGVTLPPDATPGEAPPTPPRDGDVVLTADGEICATDIRAGANSDVMIESTAAGDVLVGTVAANDGTVTIVNQDGNIDEKEINTDGNIFAQEFIGVTGNGGIGNANAPVNKETDALDIVVLESSIFVGRDQTGADEALGMINGTGGDVGLRNIGNIIYNDVEIENTAGVPGTPGLVYLLSEGVTTAGSVIVGEASDVDVLIETQNGSGMLVGNVQADGNIVSLKSADFIRTDANRLNDTAFTSQGRIQADQVLLLSEGNIGVNGAGAQAPLQLVASTTAASAAQQGIVTLAVNAGGSGDVFVDGGAATDIVIGTVTDLVCAGALTETGITNAEDVCIDVTDGDLDINEDIVVTGNVFLEASNDVLIGANINNNDPDSDADIGIEAVSGNIVQDDAGAVIDSDDALALKAGGTIGVGGAGALQVRLDDNFAAESGGNMVINVLSTQTVDVENNVSLKTGSLTGIQSGGILDLTTAGDLRVDDIITATGDICLDIGDDLDVNRNISSTGGDVAIVTRGANGDVTLGNGNTGIISSQTGGTISIVASQNVRDDNDTTMNLDTDGGLVVIDAAGNIGTVDSNDIEIAAARLAADADNGDVDIRDVDADGLDIVEADTLKVVNTITGVTASDDICIDVQSGNLDIFEDVTASDDLGLRAQAGNITIDISANSPLPPAVPNGPAQLTATDISLEASGNLVDANGDGVVATDSTTLVIDVGGSVSGDGTGTGVGNNNNFEVNADVLAAEVGGGLDVIDRDAGLTIATLTTDKGNNTIDGLDVVGDICLELTGNLDVDDDIVALGGDVGILTTGIVTIGDGAGGTDAATTESIVAVDVAGTGGVVSIEAGQVTDDNNTANGGPASISADTVVFDTTGQVGALNNEVTLDVDTIAADVGGLVGIFVDDIDGDLTVGSGSTIKGGADIDGVSSGGAVCIDAQDGDLILTEAVSGSTGTVALRAQDNIDFQNQNNRVSAPFKVSLEAVNGGIINNVNDGTADIDVFSGGDLVISAGLGVGSDAAPLEIQAAQLAVQTTNASSAGVFVDDLTGNLTITQLTLEKGGGPITGVQTAGDICIDVVAGDLTVERIVSGEDEVFLSATGDITNSIAVAENIQATDGTGRVILDAGDEILDDTDGNGAIVGNTVVLDSVNGVGNTLQDVEVEAANLAARSTTAGDVNIDENSAGLTTTVEAVYDDKNGLEQTVTGISAAEDVCLDTAGALTVVEDVEGGTDGNASEVAILAQGTVTIGDGSSGQVRNATADAGNLISVDSLGGSLVDNNGTNLAAVDANGGGVALLARGGTIGNTDFAGPDPDVVFEINADDLYAASNDDINVVDLDINADGLTLGAFTGSKFTSTAAIRASNDICIDVVNGDLTIAPTGPVASNGSIALRTQDADGVGEDGDIVIDGTGVLAVNGTVSIESASQIEAINQLSLSVAAEDVVLSSADGIGTNGTDFIVRGDNLAAQSTDSGSVNIATQALNGSEVSIVSRNTLKGNTPVVGVSSAEDVCLDIFNGNTLQINEDIVSGTNAAAGPSEIAIRAEGTLTVGNGDGDQIRNNDADAGNIIGLESVNGSLVDNNGANVAAVDANGGGDALVADNGSIGTTDFAGPGTETEFEINADVLGARSGDDVNIVDLDTNADGLTTGSVATVAKGIGAAGITAANDVCLDVVNGNLTINAGILATNGSIALRTQDADGVGEDGDVIFDGVLAFAVSGTPGDRGTVSIESASQIENLNGGIVPTVTGENVVLSSGDGIGTNGNDLFVDAENLAAQSTSSGSVNIAGGNSDGTVVNIVELDTLKGDDPVTGVSAAENVCLDIDDALQINEDVVGGTAGAASEVALRVDGDITIGDGAGGQVRNATTSTLNRISLESANGSLVDNNGANVAAADANGGDVVLSAVNGTIGNTDFNTATTPDPVFEINANRVAATSGDDVNIVDLDTNADGLEITTLVLAKLGGDVIGVTAVNDICIDVVNGDLDVNQVITATNGSIALRTQDDDNDDDADINLNGFDVTADAADQTISLESAEQITDTDDAAGSLIADNVVMLADTGIGNASEIQMDALNVAAQTTTSGDVNISDGALSNTNAGFRSEELTTLKGNVDVDGIVAAQDICLDILGDLVVDENIVSRGNVAIRTDGNIQLGDNAGTTRGVIVAGTGDDGMIGGGDDVTATVSIEAGGNITDGNGDATADTDMDGFADGANIIALGDGTTDTGGNVVLQADGGIGSDGAGGTEDDIEIDTLVVAASAGTGDVNLVEQDIVTNDGLTVGALTTEKGLTPVVGITAGEDVCVEVVSGDLRINEDVVSGTDAAVGPSEIFLQADGDIIAGDDDVNPGDGNQVRNADNDTANEIVLFSQNGSLVDNNGDGVAATDANGGDVVLSADNGPIGTTDFAGVNPDVVFEIEANRLAASSGDDVNVLDLDTDLDGLEINRITFNEKDGTPRAVGGVRATNDICIDVVNGELDVREDVIATNGSIALRTQDADGNDDGNIILNMSTGEDVVAQATGQTVSINSAVGIEDGTAGDGVVRATNIVMLADTGIGDTGASDVQVQADNLAAQTLTSGDINIAAQSLGGGVVTVAALNTLKNDTPVVGINAAEDVCIDVINGDNLQINEDVVGGTAGAASEVAIRVDGNITIGDGTDGQVRNATADTANRISLESEGGNITDNNAVGTAAADANGGDLVMSADGTIGSTDFGGPLTDSVFEINANRLAATADNGDLNILDLDTNADGLEVASIALAKGGATINGLFASQDICLDVVNGNLDINVGVSAANGSLALRTQDADNATDGVDDGDINVNAAVVADDTASLEAAGQITDGSAATSDRVEATNVVLLAEDGIGIGTDLNVDAVNLAAQSTVAGDVNIVATNSNGAVVNVEELTTLKGAATVTGINAAEDVCLDVTTDALQINEDIVSGSDAASGPSEIFVQAGGDITIGNGDGDQVRNADNDAGNEIVLFSQNGSLVDNNGNGVAAADANGGDLVLSADNGTVGTTDFAGTATLFEIEANRLAASSGDDVNILDLDTDLDGLEINGFTFNEKDGTPRAVGGVTATNDICIDVVNGELDVREDVVATNGSIALRTQDADGNDDGNIILNMSTGEDVIAQAAGQTVSINSAVGIEDGTAGDGEVIATNIVLLADTGIGDTGATDIQMLTDNLAARTLSSGDINIAAQALSGGVVTVAALDTLKTDTPVVGINAAEDVCLDVGGGDNLQINESIISGTAAGGTGDIHLEVDGNVTIGDGTGTEQVMTTDSGQTVVIDAGGDITDNNDDGVAAVSAQGGTVILRAGAGIGVADSVTPANSEAVEIDGLNLAAQAIAGDVNIIDLDNTPDGLNIVTGAFDDKAGTPVVLNGVEASEDVCIDVLVGDLNVNEDVTAVANVALRANGNVVLGEDSGNTTGVVSGTTVAVAATDGNITDGNALNNVTATNLVMTAGGGIGSDAMGDTENGIETNIDNFAASAGTGDVNINEADTLTVTTVTDTLKNITATGITAATDVCVDVVTGDLNINDNIQSNGGNIALQTQNGNVIIGNGDGDSINTDLAGGVVSIEASGNVSDENGDSDAAISTEDDGSVVLEAGGSVTGTGTSGAMEVETGTVAGVATAGDFILDDLSGDLVVGTVATLKTPTTIDGVTAGGDICIDVLADDGNLTVNEDVTAAAGNVALRADNNVVLGEADGSGVVTAAGIIGVEATNGSITDGNADTVNLVTDAGGGVVLSAGGGIGSDAAGDNENDIETDTTEFAADAGTGDVNIIELDTTTMDGLDVTTVTDALKGITATGITAQLDVCVDVVTGDLDLLAPVTSTAGDIALRAQMGSINLNGSTLTSNASGGVVSLESSGDIVDDNGDGAASIITQDDGSVVLVSGGSVIGNGASGAFEVETGTLAGRAGVTADGTTVTSAGEEFSVTDLSGDLIIGSVDSLKNPQTIDGVAASGDICVDVVDGNLNINEDIQSFGGNIALQTQDGNVTIGDGDGDSVNTDFAGGVVSIEASGNISDENGDSDAAITTEDDGSVVLEAGGSVTGTGTSGAMEVETGTVAGVATAGDFILDDLSGDLVVGTVATLKTPTTIDGVTAGGDICIDVLADGGDLTVAEDIMATGDVALRAETNVILGEDAGNTTGVVSGTTVAVAATDGNITDGNALNNVTATNLVMTAGGGIGSDAMGDTENGIETNIDNFAASAGMGDVNINEADTLTVATVTDALKGITATGITAGTDVCIDVITGDLNINDNIQSNGGNVALQTQNGNVIIGDGDGDSVNTDLSGGVVSIEASGNISDENGDSDAAISTEDDGSVVLEAGGNVTGTGTSGAMEVETGTVAGVAGATVANSDFILDDLSGDLVVGTVATLKTPTTINGVTASGDICIDVLGDGGDLTIAEDVMATGDVALRADTNVILGEDAGNTTGVVSGTTVAVAATDGNITDGNALNNVTATNLVMTAGGGIGSDAMGDTENGIETNIDNFAASAGMGDVNINEADTLTVTTVTDVLKGITATGITAGTDVCIDVITGGLDINDNIQSNGGNIALQTQNGNVTIGDGDGDSVNTDLSGGVVSIEASGNISDENGDSDAAISTEDDGSVVLEAGGSVTGTGTSGAMEIETGTVAGVAGATVANSDFILDDLSGDLVVGTVDTLKTPTTINGVTASGDICIEVLGNDGDLTVAEDIAATSNVALRANGNVVLGDDAGNTTGAVSGTSVGIVAVTGNITDGNAGVNVTSTDLVMVAVGGIGSDENGDNENEIETDVTNFAAAAISGDVNILELDTTTADGLNVTTVTDPVKNISATGVTAQEDVCLDVIDGDLDLLAPVTSTDGDIALRAQNGSINLNGSTLTSNAAGGTVSLESSGDIVDENGDGTATIITQDDGSVVLVSGGSVTGNGPSGAFEVETGTLAGRAGVSIDGTTVITPDADFVVNDLSGDLVIGSVDTLKNPALVDGVNASGDVCIEALGGDLMVNEDVTGGDEVALRALDNITLGEDGGNTTGVITAGTTAGIAALNGNITDGNAGINVTATDLVMTATGGIGSDAAGANDDAIETDVTNFAGNADTGDVNVTELDTTTADGLTVTTVTDALKGITATGVTAGEDVCIDVVDGSLEVNEDITGGNNVDIRTQDNDNDQDGDININNSVVTATAGSITIDAGGDLVDNNGLGNAALVADNNVVLDVEGELRSDEAAPDDEFEIEAAGFAARVGTGGVDVADLSGDLEIIEGVTSKDGDTIDGVTAPGEICLDVRDGNMIIGQQITSADSNVALQATGDITITGADNVTADSNGGQGVVSVEAGDEILDNGDGSFVGRDVVLESVNGIGTDNAVTVDATNLAAAGGTGRANITDIAGGVRITSLDTLKGGDTITGVTAAEDVCLQVVGGDLVIDEVVTAGTIAAIQADGNIASNATVTGTDKVSVESGGNITDGNGNTENFVGSQVVMSADGNIGSKADAIDIDSDQVAAQSLNGEVNLNETNGDLNVATLELEKNGGTVSGIDAGTDICLTADDGTLNYAGQTLQAGNEIAVRTRDTVVTSGTMETAPGGRISLEVTDGSIEDDGDNDVDFETSDLILKAEGQVGTSFDPIDTNVDRLAAQSETADVNIIEQNGLKITQLELAKDGGAINGINAATNVGVVVNQGDLGVDLVVAGNNVTLTSVQGDVKDCNGDNVNVVAGGNVTLNATQGCVEDLEVNANGVVAINDSKVRAIILPPGVFAQDNVNLGESSFYLDILYGWLEPEQLQLILDELDAYNYLEDGDFLLEKHPDGERKDDNDNEEN